MCEFVFDPDIWHGPANDLSERWECPYSSVQRTDYCPFHLTPNQRRRVFSSPHELQEAYEKAVASLNRLVVICSVIEHLDLCRLIPHLQAPDSLQIGYSQIEQINLERQALPAHLVIIESQIREIQANDSRCKEQIRIQNSDIGIANFASATIEGRSLFEGNSITSARFTSARFLDTVSFNQDVPEGTHPDELSEYQGEDPTRFEETALFYGVDFEGMADFTGVEFERGGSFFEAEFQQGASFADTDFNVGAQFEAANFLNGADFSGADLGKAGFQKARFEERTLFEKTKFGTQSVDAETIEDQNWPGLFESFLRRLEKLSAMFSRCEATAEFLIHEAYSREGLLFNESKFEHLELDVEIADERSIVTLRDGELLSGEIQLNSADSPIYEFTDATVGDVDFDYTECVELFDHLFFSNTTFEGFDFTKYRHELRGNDWIIDEVTSEDKPIFSDRRETTYAKAKAGANEIGDSHAAAKFFIRELRFRRHQHWETTREAESILGSVSAIIKGIANLTFDISCKYAESSGRVILLSVGTVSVFSLLYRTLQLHLPYATDVSLHLPLVQTSVPLEIGYVVFSIQSFTAFLLAGGAEVDSVLTRSLASVESFIGTFLIGLFVATVVRSVER